MGYFYYSGISARVTPGSLQTDIELLNRELWGDKYRVERVNGVPVSRGDSRKAKWDFWIAERTTPDCAFTISMLRGGRLEFKVPRSCWDQSWEDQQRIRRKLVRLHGTGKRSQRSG